MTLEIAPSSPYPTGSPASLPREAAAAWQEDLTQCNQGTYEKTGVELGITQGTWQRLAAQLPNHPSKPPQQEQGEKPSRITAREKSDSNPPSRLLLWAKEALGSPPWVFS